MIHAALDAVSARQESRPSDEETQAFYFVVFFFTQGADECSDHYPKEQRCRMSEVWPFASITSYMRKISSTRKGSLDNFRLKCEPATFLFAALYPTFTFSTQRRRSTAYVVD